MMTKFLFFLFCLLLVQIKLSDGYKIDFENGENRIHLESTAVRDGKIVNEPKVEEVIKTLSGFKFTNNNLNKDLNKDLNKNFNKFENIQDVEEIVENVENSRIFITNINKNINTNDENIDELRQHPQQQQYQKEKMMISGHGSASIVPMSSSSGGSKKTSSSSSFAKPLKATRVLSGSGRQRHANDEEDDNAFFARLQRQFQEKLAAQNWSENETVDRHESIESQQSDNAVHLSQVLPHLVQDPLWFADENSTTV